MMFRFYILIFALVFGVTQKVKAQNLIINPGCEMLLTGPNCGIPSWTCFTGTTWQQRQTGPLPQSGNNYFFAGNNVAMNSTAELRQMVDLTTYSTTIDLGGMMFSFSGYISSFNQAPPDESRIVLDYMDATQTIVLSQYNSGFIANVGSWLLLTNNTVVPVGTRYCRVRLTSRRNSGANNDGYFDDLSLTPVVVLPIELLNFEAACTNGLKTITWSTASESNCDQFIIERSSNMVDWSHVANIKAHGNSKTKKDYSITDNTGNLSDGLDVLYYRLKEKDFNGNITVYRSVQLLECIGKSEILFFPNPANDRLTILGDFNTVSIFNALGQLMLNQSKKVDNSSIDISFLASGIYFVSVNDGIPQKLIIN